MEPTHSDQISQLDAQITALSQKLPTLAPDQMATAVSQLQQLISQREKLAAQTAVSVDGQDNITAAEQSVAVAGGVQGNVTVRHIHNIYQQAPGKPLLDEEAFGDAVGRYLAWVEKRYGRLNLRGVEKREQQVLSLTLDDVYVSLAAIVNPERKKRQQLEAALREERLEPVDMRRLLSLSPRLVITGGPGSGKTTYLHLLAANIARATRSNEAEALSSQLGLTGPLPLPIVIPLTEYNRYRKQYSQPDDPRRGTLIAFISHSLIREQAGIGLPEDFFERLLIKGKSCLLLLDGLDEVANERERILVRRWVENLAYNEGVRQIVVSSRTRAYQGQAVLPEEFRVAAVQPMTDTQVAALVARWCTAVYEDGDTTQETNRLQEAISGLEKLRKARGEPRLADTPLLVTIIAVVHYNQRRLPDQRAELYEKCVDVLLTEGNKPATEATFELADWGGTLAEKRELLAHLAYEMMSAGAEAGRSVSEDQQESWLWPRLVRRHGEEQAGQKFIQFVQAMRERGSLLAERGGSYQFTHLTFQEFLCAYYLAETMRDPAKIVGFLAENERFLDSWWRETILLTVGYLGLKSVDTALALVAQMITLPEQDEAALAAVELAAAGFLELESQDEPTQAAVTTGLLALLTDAELRAAPAVRMLAGDALGRLGDPRPGVCTLEPELIPIPAGSFLMGDEEVTEVEITQPYAIGRYPVTVAQYEMFVADDGYKKQWQHCWTGAGWHEKENRNWSGPRYDGQEYKLSNTPVTGVSWYEAVAYSRWLAEKTGKSYRLPTEAEWERAARHTDGCIYPWGDTWQNGIANNKEAELDRPTAVGSFPQDRAVCGVQDISGNVNEWCQTRWRNENGKTYSLPYRADDGRENLDGRNYIWRVIRGGAFVDGQNNYPRCGARSRSRPNFDLWYYGFRVVVSPFFDAGR